MTATTTRFPQATHAILLCAAILGATLTGCGSMVVAEDWKDAPTFPALRPVLMEVAQAKISGVCGGSFEVKIYGCSYRVIADGMCVIFTPPQPPQWLMDHELKHCAGWEHKSPSLLRT
jgi:hypothetical protein